MSAHSGRRAAEGVACGEVANGLRSTLSSSTRAIELPLDLPHRFVCPGCAPRPDPDSQMVVEAAEPRLRNLVSLQIGPRGASQPGLGVDQRPELTVDGNVVLGAIFRLFRCPRVGVAPRAEPVPVGPRRGELTGDRVWVARPIEEDRRRAVDLLGPQSQTRLSALGPSTFQESRDFAEERLHRSIRCSEQSSKRVSSAPLRETPRARSSSASSHTEPSPKVPSPQVAGS